MSAKFIAGALGLVFLLLAIVAMPDIGDSHELFSAGGTLNAIHLLIGIVLSMAAFSAGHARPHVVLAAVVYGVVALFGLNKTVSANWPDLFGADGRWMAAGLAPVLGLGALIARDGVHDDKAVASTPQPEPRQPVAAPDPKPVERAEPNPLPQVMKQETGGGSVPASGQSKTTA